MARQLLEISKDEAALLLRGIKRLLSYLKCTDNGSVNRQVDIDDCKRLILELEHITK